jgi:uncharacterized low-complexity protein
MTTTNKSTSAKAVALAVTSSFVLSVAATTVSAAENPFAIKSLSSGYQVAEHHEKAKDGKCGAEMKKEGAKEMKDGKCGAEMTKDGAKEMKDGKCGEGKCGAEKAK